MRLLSYTPSHCDPALLEKLTSGQARKALISTLADAVRNEVGRPSHQHQLIIGPRGSGKTHMLALVRHILKTDEALAAKVVVVHLAEEEVIRRPADLLIRVLERLVQQMPAQLPNVAARERINMHLTRLRSESHHERALELAAAAIEDTALTLGALLVATIENLDAILFAGPGLSRDSALQAQWGLRKALQQSAGLMVIASAPTIFGEVTDPKAPFHDFFRTHQLEELSNDEMLALIRTRLAAELQGSRGDARRHRRLQVLEDAFDERAPKLRGLLTLTGGLPRFGHLIFDLLVEVDAAGIMDTLAAFLDEQTPYFQPKLDPRMVPEGELEVLDAIASAPGPLTVSELAGILRGGTANAAAMYLKRLRARGLVRERRSGPRSVHYDVAEPLFRIWRRFRIGRSEQEQILMLAEFVAAMFSPAELVADRAVLKEAPESDARGIELLNQAIALGNGHSEGGSPLDRALNELWREAQRALHEDNLDRAMELADDGMTRAREAGDPRVRGEWAGLLGDVLWKMRRREAADAYLEAAGAFSECGDEETRGWCLARRGGVLSHFAMWEGAAEAYGQAVPLLPLARRGSVLLDRALALRKWQRKKEAAQSYAEAISVFRDRGDQTAGIMLNRCAMDLETLGEGELAVAAYLDAASAFSKHRDEDSRALTLVRAAALLSKLGKRDEAVHEYLLAAHAYSRLHDGEAYSQGILKVVVRVADLLAPPTDAAAVVADFAPYLARAAERKEGRTALVTIARSVLASQGPEVALAVLPRLEGTLPASHASLLRPLRLAAEILAKRRPPAMTAEPEEMHRAVADVLRWFEATARTRQP